ncbi:DUF2500 domain-containing protein [Metasolibacillus meyeri]|uniref:DUF2500 domain-containing protein n=1 Tax=Metasolibacillus meyeri TaxID=1071052 RepID=UPI000D2F738D|nr:DUF2500 domain-containing protein [Metasolibacillus meyeri]
MYYDPNPLGSAMFTLVPLFIISVFIFIVVKGIAEWSANNNSPKLTVPAIVVTKRTHTSRDHHHTNDHMHTTLTTSYYVTFQFESNDRAEFSLNGSQYGMLAEGDTGMLTFQGTRYLGFKRIQ